MSAPASARSSASGTPTAACSATTRCPSTRQPETPPPADRIKAIHRCLERAGIPHAFGGALALAYYAEPRATKDIDVNVFVPEEREPEVKAALAPLQDDPEHPIHLFFSCDPLHQEMERKVREVPFDEETIPLVSPEHLVIRKTILDRPKDRSDIEAILAATEIDHEEIENWVQRLGPG